MNINTKYLRLKIEIGKRKPRVWHPELEKWVYIKEQKSVGLGDTVYKIISFFGIKFKDNCGCETRRDVLNRWFPYKN